MSTSSSLNSFKRMRLIGLIVLLCAILAVAWGIFSRRAAHADLVSDAEQAAIPHVGVMHPLSDESGGELVLPGTLQAWVETTLYAHTSGYLKSWKVDIGQAVTAGQLIAEIETPEIVQQALQAEADLRTAVANAQLAEITAQRYTTLLATKTVSQQDLDNKQYDAAAKQAAVQAARNNLERFHQLDVYKRIVAPYNGIITVRNIDIGTMIDTGSANGKARELFHLADTRKLRAYIPVPEDQGALVHKGDTVPISVRGQAGRTWSALCTDTAHAVDPVTHTVLVELQLDNPQNTLLPGAYIEAHFRQHSAPGVVTMPANALIFRAEGTFMAVLLPDNTVHLQPITVGKNLGRAIEITQGLNAGQQVIVSPPDDISEGDRVAPEELTRMQRKTS